MPIAIAFRLQPRRFGITTCMPTYQVNPAVGAG